MKKLGYSMLQRIVTTGLLRNICLLGLTLPFLASATSLVIAGENENENRNAPYTIGLWGDLPYSEAQEVGVNRLIEDMNS